MTPFSIQVLDHIVLRTGRVEEMIKFYCDVLGCNVERRLDGEVGLIQLRAGKSLIDFVSLDGSLGKQGGRGPGVEGRNVAHFCLSIDPFDEDAIRSHLGRHEVEATRTALLYGAEGVGPSIYIEDPEGNTVELKGPSEMPKGE